MISILTLLFLTVPLHHKIMLLFIKNQHTGLLKRYLFSPNIFKSVLN
jgi:hypothetical protein